MKTKKTTPVLDQIFIDTPVGALLVTADNNYIFEVSFTNKKYNLAQTKSKNPLLMQAKKELQLYFNKKLTRFTLPLNLENQGTKFQNAVWKAMMNIPYGKTLSYSDLAKKIHRPKAARAVGMGCNKNPIGIIVPCHRVIGKNRSLTGYAHGLKTKAFLLELEENGATC